MPSNIHMKSGDKLVICGEEYSLIKRLGHMTGFQFRTWLVKNRSGKKYVAKITEDPKRALNELRAYIYLKTKGYPERYYAEMVAFDHEAKHVRSARNFYAILLKYLPEEKFRTLDEYLRNRRRKRVLAEKLRRRVDRLHGLNIAHGDIREQNIMVKETKRGIGLRLIDFGLSTFGDEEKIRKDKQAVEKIIEKILGGKEKFQSSSLP
jgi:tRNA A-37 threonylcarbamoyl transferase component Bud32